MFLALPRLREENHHEFEGGLITRPVPNQKVKKHTVARSEEKIAETDRRE